MRIDVFETQLLLPMMSPYALHQRIWDEYVGGRSNNEERDYIFQFKEVGSNLLVALRTHGDSVAADSFQQRLSPVTYDVAPTVRYAFEIRVAPEVRRNRTVIHTPQNEEAAAWFAQKAERHGFHVTRIDECVSQARVFHGKKRRRITLNDTFIRGELVVTGSGPFLEALCCGVGRHKGLGYGMLHLLTPFNHEDKE